MHDIATSTQELRSLLIESDFFGSSPILESHELITEYYRLVLKWNDLLHLTTITAPQQFLERHLIEVFSALPYIDKDVDTIWDLGSGLGVPGIPFRLFRPDLEVVLVESNRRKVLFLETVVAELGLVQTHVIHSKIQALPLPASSVLLTGRAIERMESLFPAILQLGASARQIILFTTTRLTAFLPGAQIHYLSGAADRCLAVLKCSTWNT